MPATQFLTFASAVGANVLSLAGYTGLAARLDGFSAGIAKSEELNRVWRQSANVANALTQMIVDRLGQDVLDNGDQAALIAQMKAAIADPAGATRAGELFMWPMSTPPAYALERNGQLVSRVTYAALFAVIGETYGAGDGSTTFNVPDDRGLFERGWDHGAGIGTNVTFGAVQGDTIGPLAVNLPVYRVNPAGAGVSRLVGNDNGGASNYNLNLSANVETRPKNRSYLPCIRWR